MTARGRLSRLGHPVVVVGAIVVLGTLLSWRHTRHAHEWLVMTDELQYLKLALSFGDGSFPLPTLRGERTELLSVLYPLLIAPVFAAFSMPEAYQLVHLLNALLIASTAVPVYLLARQLLDRRWPCYLAAALAIAVPWAATSAVIMTESAAYPAFAWAVLAIQRALVAPSPGRDLVALVAIAMAFLARTQLFFLAAAFPALIVLHELLFAMVARDRGSDRRARLRLLLDRLRPHAPLGGLIALALVLLMLPNNPLKGLLGPFQATASEGALPAGLAPAMRTQLVFVAGGIGFIPLALGVGWMLSSLVRPVDRRGHAFAALVLVVGALLVYVVTVFGLRHAPGPADRYLFYLAPLLIVATVACLAQAPARALGLIGGAAFTFWILRTSGVAFVDTPGIYVNSPVTEFHRVLQGQSSRFGAAFGHDGLTAVELISWATLLVTAAVWLLVRRAPRVAVAIVGLPLLGLALAQTDYVSKQRTLHTNASLITVDPIPLSQRDWIDDALPRDGDVAISPSPLNVPGSSQLVWWSAEFWNKRVNRAVILDLYGDNTPFPYKQMFLDERTGSVRIDGPQPPFMVFAISQIGFRPMGRLLAEHRTALQTDPGLELFEVQRPYRAGWIADGAAADGWIVRGTPARIRVFPRADGRAQRLTVNVDLPVSLVPASPFELRSGNRVARAQAAAGTIRGDTRVSVCIAPGGLREAFVSTRAVRPLPDGRKVGVHLQGIRVEPAGAGC